MTIRIAPSRTFARSLVSHRFAAPLALIPANDNARPQAAKLADDKVLREALRYFSRHGLQAAAQARDEALAAHAGGDEERYRWWLAICRMLDPRLADRTATELTLAG